MTPNHVAFIMDGNGRWAGKKGLPRISGHRVGVDNIPRILTHLEKRGVKFVTIFAFSTENWNRPSGEVDGLIRILQDSLDNQTPILHKNNVRIIHIGEVVKLSDEIIRSIRSAEDLTVHNDGITLNVAFDYGGRNEILNAVKSIISDGTPSCDITEKHFSKYLYTSESPDPDLIIRTGGEIRLSNFLLWQAAYSEYYHTKVMWPDFQEKHIDKALSAFNKRQRRFGKVLETSS
ncbi:MAG: di-trans,poly-cis-decaprenylcistransferase [Dehalococcoidia bacterium]|nr:di-trans,poly-cis-decaprenylcistransferase [Dehalococcoidia bacterium]